jgi:hypothetical protein
MAGRRQLSAPGEVESAASLRAPAGPRRALHLRRALQARPGSSPRFRRDRPRNPRSESALLRRAVWRDRRPPPARRGVWAGNCQGPECPTSLATDVHPGTLRGILSDRPRCPHLFSAESAQPAASSHTATHHRAVSAAKPSSHPHLTTRACSEERIDGSSAAHERTLTKCCSITFPASAFRFPVFSLVGPPR